LAAFFLTLSSTLRGFALLIGLRECLAPTTVSVYNRRFDGYVRIHPDGYVELTSPAGTVIARFKELEKVDWLRESYIRMLLESGMHGHELQEALAASKEVSSQ